MSLRQVALDALIEPAPLERARNRELPILSMTMHEGLVDQAMKFKKRVASTDTAEYKLVRRNQLVVGFPIDEGVLSFQDLYDEAIVSPAYEVWNIRETHHMEPAYLERFLRSPRALAFYKTRLRGTTARRRTLPDDVFLSLNVPLPSRVEQVRITEILDKADVLRAKRREAIAQLETLTQAIFADMFGDPVTNPKMWPRRPLRDIGQVITGNTPSRQNKDYYGSAIEWIKSDNIDPELRYLTRAVEKLSLLGKSVGRVAPPGSILITCIAGSPNSIGNVAIADREVAFNQQINAVVPHDENTAFLFTQLLVGKRLIQAESTASMKGLVSKSRLEAVSLIYPPLDLQREFVKRFNCVERIRHLYAKALTELETLCRSLQQRAFEGAL